jgi:hypothetical protein
VRRRLAAFAAVPVALLLLGAAAPARAQSKTGTVFGSFLEIEPSARIAAMGNAGATVPDGIDAVYYNPAAIGRTSRWGLNFTHSAWFADIAYNSVAASMPMGRWGNGFLSVTSLNSGDIEVRTVSQPLGTGELYSASDVALGLGWGKEITDRFSMGAQLTFVQETIWHSSAGSAVLGFGTLYQVSDHGLRIGASLSNFGTQTEFAGRDLRATIDADPSRFGDNGQLPASQFTDPFSMPVMFRVGLGMPVRIDNDHELRLALDAKHPSDNTESLSAGAELVYHRSVSLRWGYQEAFQEDSEVGLTAGAGIEGDTGGRHYQCDYGWADHGRLGNVHRFSLTLLF